MIEAGGVPRKVGEHGGGDRRGPPFARWSSGTIGGLGKADEMGVSDVADGMRP
jgi:hypothetical protein